jgi:hypothetical protein
MKIAPVAIPPNRAVAVRKERRSIGRLSLL